jgi:hypothetical protein
LRKQIAVERELLRQNLADHAPLVGECAVRTPGRIELSALGAMLQGFYGGIENIFKRVRIELNEGLPVGEGWHKALLEAMALPGPQRPAVISASLARTLAAYLKFRHFFRVAYPFLLRWEEMAELVNGSQDVLGRLETELGAFLKATEGKE